MSVHDFVARLDKVKETGRGNWTACCPAHEDKHPSLCIKESDDGRVLVHCFTGCSVESILSAVGLEFDVLFPDKPVPLKDGRASPARIQFNPRDVIDAVAREVIFVALFSRQVARGEPVTPEDRERMLVCAERLEQARRFVNG